MRHFIAVIFFATLLLIVVPIAINQNMGNIEGKDFLTYYAALFPFLSTVGLGAVAVWQNNKANRLNNKLQRQQIILYEKEVADKELAEIKAIIEKVLLSFDTGVFAFSFNNISIFDFTELILKLELVLNTSNAHIFVYLERIQCFTLCEVLFEGLQQEPNDFICEKSIEYLTHLYNFKKCIRAYSDKYINAVDICTKILKKRYNTLKLNASIDGTTVDNLQFNYTEKQMNTEIKAIIQDLHAIRTTDYTYLKKQAYAFVMHCEIEAAEKFNKIKKDLIQDM